MIPEGYAVVVLKRLGSELRLARKREGMRQEDVAAKLGVSQSTISTWESGEGLQAVETLFDLAALYRTSIVDFVTGVNPAYDRLGLTSRVTDSSTDRGIQKGGASDVPQPSDQDRIRELESELRALKAEVRKRALDLTDLASDDAGLRSARTHTARRGRKNRPSR